MPRKITDSYRFALGLGEPLVFMRLRLPDAMRDPHLWLRVGDHIATSAGEVYFVTHVAPGDVRAVTAEGAEAQVINIVNWTLTARVPR